MPPLTNERVNVRACQAEGIAAAKDRGARDATGDFLLPGRDLRKAQVIIKRTFL